MQASILEQYSADVSQAYEQMLEELARLLKQLKVTAQLSVTEHAAIQVDVIQDQEPEDLLDRKAKVIGIIGRCGGKIGAAGRRARSAIATEHLDMLVESGHDLTATTANNLTKQAGGTGLGRLARAKYGTPGRTAANKTGIQNSPVAEATVTAITADLSAFKEASVHIREAIAKHWLESWKSLSAEESPFMVRNTQT